MDDRRLDELLGRTHAGSPTPDALIPRIEARIRLRQRVRRSLAGSSLVLVAVAVVVFVVGRPTAPAPVLDPGEPLIADAATPTRVILDDAYLAQRLESNHPNVTIVRVFQRYVEVEEESPADPASMVPWTGQPEIAQTQLVTRS